MSCRSRQEWRRSMGLLLQGRESRRRRTPSGVRPAPSGRPLDQGRRCGTQQSGAREGHSQGHRRWRHFTEGRCESSGRHCTVQPRQEQAVRPSLTEQQVDLGPNGHREEQGCPLGEPRPVYQTAQQVVGRVQRPKGRPSGRPGQIVRPLDRALFKIVG